MGLEFTELDPYNRKKNLVLNFIKENRNFITPFFEKNIGISKVVSTNGSHLHSATCTGFVLYYCSLILALPDEKYSSDVEAPIKSLFGECSSELIRKFLAEHTRTKGKRQIRNTKTGPLPNNYNTPLQLLGILSSTTTVEPQYRKKFYKCVEGLINNVFIKDITKNKGYIDRIGTSEAPSPYLTYWVIQCILKYDEKRGVNLLKPVSEDILYWASNALSRNISYTYSGMSQHFDSIDVMYLILILLSLLDKDNLLESESSPVSTIRKQVSHALEIIFKKNFNNGCFTKSLPVFADKNNFSLSCPTVEPVALLLAQHPEYLYNYFDELSQIYDWINANKFKSTDGKVNLWRSEWEHSSTLPTSFMAISVYAYISAFLSFVDHLLIEKSKESLGVLKYSYNDLVNGFGYPGDLGTILDKNLIQPIQEGNRSFAALSIIFYGPPGTSKTSISKKLAQDLEWPLLTINTNSFLKSGIEKIDFEAEKIFKLVSYLKDVVILFDEVEELVLSRHPSDSQSEQRSRLLTTSMLPRINDLRDTNRVVFIFATNYLDQIDSAIIRTGRFDCVYCVLTPTPDERIGIVNNVCNRYKIEERIKEILLMPDNINKMERFCYADIEALTKRVVNRMRGKKKVINSKLELLVNKEIDVGMGGVISEEEYIKFKKSKENFDRPNYKK